MFPAPLKAMDGLLLMQKFPELAFFITMIYYTRKSLFSSTQKEFRLLLIGIEKNVILNEIVLRLDVF